MGLRAVLFINFVFTPEAVNYILLRATISTLKIFTLEPSTEPPHCIIVESCKSNLSALRGQAFSP